MSSLDCLSHMCGVRITPPAVCCGPFPLLVSEPIHHFPRCWEDDVLETCLLGDIASSAQPVIESIKAGLAQTCATTARDGNVRLKVAFVGYRDICDGPRRFVVHDFDEPANIAQWMETIIVTGSGDEGAKDVIGGLEKVAALSWGANIRLLIHLVDAPAHGMQFHGPDVRDDHPEGLPGQNPAQTLAQLHAMHILYRMFMLAHPQPMMYKAFQGMFEQDGDHMCLLTKYRVRYDLSDLMSVFTRASEAAIICHRTNHHGCCPHASAPPGPVNEAHDSLSPADPAT
ncbi:hypothetical protein PAPYR_2646 [Paratrimastix pyriformis]|uniref:Uncharacterized protein n=1 Tax=Paratrimastix pyriformis TaxID=342808 RepID=A0ABQ8URV2_9EUKA|nr:hypothetical protein PAPYR_2646 [Paratrimastix pyriformis]